jgi:hypothetical protein
LPANVCQQNERLLLKFNKQDLQFAEPATQKHP